MTPGATSHIPISTFPEDRGLLRPVEFRDLPFTPVRAFTISGVPKWATRAEHAPTCDEFLVMASGSCEALIGRDEDTVELTFDGPGLYVPGGTWLGLRAFSEDACLLVLASLPYYQTTYIEQ